MRFIGTCLKCTGIQEKTVKKSDSSARFGTLSNDGDHQSHCQPWVDVDDTAQIVVTKKVAKAHDKRQHQEAFVIKRLKGCSCVDVSHRVHVALDRVAGVVFKNQIVGASKIVAVVVHLHVAGIDPYDGSDRDKRSQHERIQSVRVRTIEKKKKKRRKNAYDGDATLVE